MSSYIDIFGGQTVQNANTSYVLINLTQNITLSWPTEFQNINKIVCYYMDINPNANGHTVTLPDATNVSPGSAFVVTNPSGNTFGLLKNDGTNLLNPVPAGASSEFYLIDNTTAAGDWRVIPRGAGFATVTSVNADVPNATDNANLVVAGGPIVNAGVLHFSLAGDLRALTRFAGGTGFAVRTAVNTWALRSIVPAANANIQITNGSGVLGNPTIDLIQTPGVAPFTRITEILVGNIDITGNTISTQNANGNLNIALNGTGETVTANPIRITTGSLLKFYNADNSHFISFSGSAIPAGGGGFDLNLTWPSTNPAAGQVLQYIGGGPPNLAWATVATVSGGPTTVNAIARYASTGGILQNSGVTIDGSNNVVSPGNITSNTSFISGDVFLASNLNTLGTTNGDLNISPAGTANTKINSNLYVGTQASPKSLLFPQATNVFTVSLTAPAGIAGNIALTLPPTVGGNTALLQSNGAGVLTFTDVGGGTGTSGTTATALVTRNATSTINPVVPANMVAHDGVIKSEATFAGATGNVSFSYNINGNIARAGAGQYTATFTTAMANTTYGIVLSCDRAATFLNYTNKTVNGFDIRAFDQTGGGAVDPGEISFICFGRQF